MMRISVFVACLFLLALAGSVALAAPMTTPSTGRGVPGGAETQGVPNTGAPTDPNAWEAVTSQFASNTTDDATLGQHASAPATPRLGVGNVARNDGGTGGRPSDHACVVGPFFGSDCSGDPGLLP
jgi:hypothetical protein